MLTTISDKKIDVTDWDKALSKNCKPEFKQMRNVIFFLVMFFSCKNEKRNVSQKLVKEELHIGDSLRNCISAKDTIMDSENFVKYIVVDSSFTLKVRVGGIDTLLPYQFNCSVPGGLVPSLHSFYKSTICLKRGHGFDYREFMIGYVENGKGYMRQLRKSRVRLKQIH